MGRYVGFPLGFLLVAWGLGLGLWAPLAAGRFVVEKNSLMVISPSELKGKHDSAIGNFGIPQYGGSMAGAVVYPKENAMACDQFSRSDLFKPKPGALPNFILIDRGGSRNLLFSFFSKSSFHFLGRQIVNRFEILGSL
ncbi:hypothetical protein B296_00026263 [Ensete ventricosum]|uniref:Uncharacterized protein n=1 Tax=Ensete ventricosum TaxID=4639 RepID=A0A426ZD07_ENSVE|nr:hypothetical protein B296_00026263 [Ensete ventricosum]